MKFKIISVLVIYLCIINVVFSLSNEEIDKAIKEGDELFKNGKYDLALDKFTLAIDSIGSEVHTSLVSVLFKRAGIYQTKGKNILALSDVNRAIEINPDNIHAHIKKAKILTSLGRFSQAIEGYNHILKVKPDNSQAKKSLEDLIQIEKSMNKAKSLITDDKKYSEAIPILSGIIDKVGDLREARLLRSQCNYIQGEYRKVVDDTMAILKVEPSCVDAYFWRGKAFFSMGEKDAALKFLREGLKFDPDHEKSRDQLKLISKFDKFVSEANDLFNNQQNYEAALDRAESALEIEPKNPSYSPQLYIIKCKALQKMRKIPESIEACTKAIELQPDNTDAYLARGEGFMFEEDYQKALNDFNKAREIKPNDGAIHDAIRRAQKAQKMGARKDYYKILGVPKIATIKEIKKAFKVLALQNHPDKASPDEREKAEKKYTDITEAYEVLTDQDKRDKYDRGEDLQEMPGGGGGGFPFNPFGGGGHPGGGGFQQGGGGFHYSFNFG